MLAFLSWAVLTLFWNRTHEGSPAFKFFAAIIRPGFDCGHYLAAVLFGNNPQLAAEGLMGLASLLVMYTAFWYAVMGIIRRVRSNKHSDSNEGFSGPNA